MKQKLTNFDVFKKKLMDDLKPETVCRTIMCRACPLRDANINGCYECNAHLLEWFKQEAK